MSDIKQVKIDNWGIFFLQRLQQFFNRTDFCDLTLQFENNVQLKVHRLVMNACTEYFQVLENTCDVVDDCLIMPLDLQPDVVVPIVNFMYTGQLEFQMSNYDKLYAAAKLMNLTVLTKLLDAQKVPVSPLAKPLHKRTSVGAVTWNLQGKKIVPKTMDPDLPEPLPGRKLPVWKRKTIPTSFRASTSEFLSESVVSSYKSSASSTPKALDNTPRPTRFEWPEDEIPSTDIMVSSFDDISYGSQPLSAPIVKSNSMNNSSAAFEELKKTAQTLKRPATSSYNHHSPVNLQDVKEYLQEQKLRNDYILRNEERNSQNEDSNDNIEFRDENSSGGEVIFGNENPNKSILKPSSNDEEHTPAKKVRFSLEGKENASKGKKSIIEAKVKVESGDLTNHTKIISEVLKKYPYLMQKNKNIKLKIMQKNQTEAEQSGAPSPKKIKILKNADDKVKIIEEKIVAKSNTAKGSVSGNSSADEDHKEYKCKDCNIPNEYIQLQSYSEFHDHMVEFHPERIDPRVCEHCGHRSTRRHLLVYHQLTKHGITPPEPFVFPQCDICDYVAVNTTLLRRHQTGVHGTITKAVTEEKERIVCPTCKATFKKNLLFIRHCNQTEHNKNMNFDCEYCPKKFLRASYVIAHMKSYHKPELEHDNVDLDEQEKEAPKSEIKILSNIPITTNIEDIECKTDMVVPTTSVPSSEAEALVNVASGIAASLGLVVLDENQFVIQTQDDCVTGTEEYVMPEMHAADGGILHQATPQTIALTVTDPQNTNNIVTTATTPVTTTDELVMVLTDHDYSDGNTPIITSENSNIVVLYSHPVEGQTTQYISPEGNIVLNSQTGVIEMNGHKLQVTNAEHLEIKNDTDVGDKTMEMQQQQQIIEPEESIEMIQQEINNHFQTTEKLNQEMIQHTNVVNEILSAEIQPQLASTQTAEETSEDLAKTLGDKDETDLSQEKETPLVQEVENLENTVSEPTLPENLEPEPMDVDEEIINDTIAKVDSPKVEEVPTDNQNEEKIEPISEPSTENENPETNLPLNESMDIDEADNTLKANESENESADSVEINQQLLNDNVKPTEENVPEITNEAEEKAATIENLDETLTEEKPTDESADTNTVTPTENNEELPSLPVELPPLIPLEQEISKDVEPEVTETEVQNETNNIVESTETEVPVKDEEAIIKPEELTTEHQEEIQELQETETKIEGEDMKIETTDTEISKSTEKVEQGEPKTEEQPNEEISENEAIPTKDNVTSLVSDWCDDDSGLQGSGSESVPQNTEKDAAATTEKVEGNEFVVPIDGATIEANKDENKPSNMKITKLLDDWDDGDTDSQNSGENPQQVTKNPINNLIEDWDDE